MNRWLIAAGEWAVLIPLWRKFIRPRNGRVAAAMAIAAVWLVILVAVAGAGSGDDKSDSTDLQAEARASATPERTARSTRTSSTSPTPSASSDQTAQPTATPELPNATPVPSAGAADTPPAPPEPAQTFTVVSSSSYVDDVGTLHVAGEVRNNSAEYMEFVEITGTFFNAGEQVVGSDYTYTHADFVAPGEIAGFDLPLVNGGSLGVSRYDLAIIGEVTADRPAPGLVVQGESSNIDAGGDYHIVGQVANQSAQPAIYVKVIGTFYAGDGTVIRSDFAYTDLDELPAGGTDSFDLIVPAGGSAGIARYTLKVEATQP